MLWYTACITVNKHHAGFFKFPCKHSTQLSAAGWSHCICHNHSWVHAAADTPSEAAHTIQNNE